MALLVRACRFVDCCYIFLGTGKSVVLRRLVQLYGDKCLVVATSAQSAFACGGSTYHSVFFTPINGSRRELELQDDLLEKMQATCRDKMYLIIEEAGMLSLEDFGYLSLRLSQARARPGSSAGNWSIILIGDFGQLPPVTKPGNVAHPLYSVPAGARENDSERATVRMAGLALFSTFQKVIWLQTIHRQAGDTESQRGLRRALWHLRQGRADAADFALLMSRGNGVLSPKEVSGFEDAVHLFSTRVAVVNFNNARLLRTKDDGLLVRVRAQHNSPAAAKRPPADAGKLRSDLFTRIGCPVRVLKNFWPEVGGVNAALGTLRGALFEEHSKPGDVPYCFLVALQKWTGPDVGTDLILNQPIVPIFPQQFSFDQKYKRRTIPVDCAYATTIHSAQGATYDRVVVDFGQRDFSLGLSYTAASRCTKLENVMFQQCSFQRLVVIETQLAKHLLERLYADKKFLQRSVMLTRAFALKYPELWQQCAGEEDSANWQATPSGLDADIQYHTETVAILCNASGQKGAGRSQVVASLVNRAKFQHDICPEAVPLAAKVQLSPIYPVRRAEPPTDTYQPTLTEIESMADRFRQGILHSATPEQLGLRRALRSAEQKTIARLHVFYECLVQHFKDRIPGAPNKQNFCYGISLLAAMTFPIKQGVLSADRCVANSLLWSLVTACQWWNDLGPEGPILGRELLHQAVCDAYRLYIRNEFGNPQNLVSELGSRGNDDLARQVFESAVIEEVSACQYCQAPQSERVVLGSKCDIDDQACYQRGFQLQQAPRIGLNLSKNMFVFSDSKDTNSLQDLWSVMKTGVTLSPSQCVCGSSLQRRRWLRTGQLLFVNILEVDWWMSLDCPQVLRHGSERYDLVARIQCTHPEGRHYYARYLSGDLGDPDVVSPVVWLF